MERLEAFHRARDLLYETVILLNNIVKIYDLKDVDQAEPSVYMKRLCIFLRLGRLAPLLSITTLSGTPLSLRVRVEKVVAVA